LEPEDYNNKMCEKDTVIIDVRNHYEANIGRFNPPESGAKMIDPMMRKSTEFPIWLDKPETKEMLRGKQVLMYCVSLSQDDLKQIIDTLHAHQTNLSLFRLEESDVNELARY
jgi:hypothetical protein